MQEATLRSTTGTAPIEFTPSVQGRIGIALEDGSMQVYDRDDIRAVLEAVLGW